MILNNKFFHNIQNNTISTNNNTNNINNDF